MPATRHEDHDDMIAGDEIGLPVTNRLDDSRRLVRPNASGHRSRAIPIDHREIGMTGARPARSDQDFPWPERRLEGLDVVVALDVEPRNLHLPQNGRLDVGFCGSPKEHAPPAREKGRSSRSGSF